MMKLKINLIKKRIQYKTNNNQFLYIEKLKKDEFERNI